MGRRVWFREIWQFLFEDRRIVNGPSLAAFWGAPQDAEEESMAVGRRVAIFPEAMPANNDNANAA
jgi:anaerobic magnesium-protoporphyrin IX monomethyl ester cyclase